MGGVVHNREKSFRAIQDDLARGQQNLREAFTELRDGFEDDIAAQLGEQLAEQLAVAKTAMENEIAATLRAEAA